MLIITRKVNQAFRIGDDVDVRILAIERNGTRVRIGIRAPDEKAVIRDDAHTRTRKARQ